MIGQTAFSDMTEDELAGIVRDHIANPYRGTVSNYVAASSELARRSREKALEGGHAAMNISTQYRAL